MRESDRGRYDESPVRHLSWLVDEAGSSFMPSRGSKVDEARRVQHAAGCPCRLRFINRFIIIFYSRKNDKYARPFFIISSSFQHSVSIDRDNERSVQAVSVESESSDRRLKNRLPAS